MKDVYPRATSLVESARVDVASIVSHHFPLTKVDQAFEFAALRAGLKVMVDPNADSPSS
jgi:threonine dehydrogenase-like Zn-dependent dehydrogenase